MKQCPTVSILIITYNHKNFIRDAIESALMQKTRCDVEIVIGDDYSTDGTREIIREYGNKHPDKIRMLLHSHNLGPPEIPGKNNFVITFQACRGKFIALLDGDDYWTSPHKLQKQINFLDKHPECTICFHAFKRISEDKSQKPEVMFPPGRKTIYTLEDFLQCSFIGTPTTVFRNRPFDNFPEWFYRMPQGDWPLHILNAQYGTIGYIDEVMAVHRIHQNGVWFSKGIAFMVENTIKAQEIINPYLQMKYQKINLQSCYKLSYNLTKHYEEQRDIQRARYFAKKCFTLRRYNDKNLIVLLKLFFILYMPSRLVKLIRKLNG